MNAMFLGENLERPEHPAARTALGMASATLILGSAGALIGKAVAKSPTIGAVVGASVGAAIVGGLLEKPIFGGAPNNPPTGGIYNASSAIVVSLGGSFTVPVGSSVRVEASSAPRLWAAPGVLTSNATVLTPSIPSTTNGFVAIAPGTATLTGTTYGGSTGSVQIAVVP